MRKIAVLLGCCLLASLCGAEIRDGVKYGISNDDPVFQKSYPQLKELNRHGGIATINLTVKNEKGVPIQGAEGGAWFWYKNGGTSSKDISDENGKLTLSNKVTTDSAYRIDKEGFYYSEGYVRSFEAPDEPFGFFERRRWKPVIRDVVLKTKRNPIPMYSHRVDNKQIPALETPLGFDLQVADWVKPHGEGVVPDVYITVNVTRVSFGRKTWLKPTKVTFDFPNKYDGVQVHDAAYWSEFISSYSVDLTKPFQKQLVLHPGETDYDWLDHRKYLVFRVRSETSSSGELVRCNYGKIYPFIKFTDEEFIIKSIVFNPNPNDTNLEFDPKRNLTDKNGYEGTTKKQSAP